MAVQLPSTMLPYQYIIYSAEAFFWILSIFLNGFFLTILKNITTVHRNLRLLIGNMIVVYCVVGILRCLHISDLMGNYMSPELAYLVQLVRKIAITAKTASEVTLLIERVLSTILASKYEKNNSKVISVGLISICYCYPAITLPLSSSGVVGPVVFLPLPIIFDILSWIFLYILFNVNTNTFTSETSLQIGQFQLSKRYQTAENIKTLRMIFWFLVYSTISNAITVSIYCWYVFYIDPNNRHDLFGFFDAFWYCLNAFSASLLSLPFIVKHEIIRKRYMNLICKQSSKISSRQLRSVTGKALLNETNAFIHFKDLKMAWEGPNKIFGRTIIAINRWYSALPIKNCSKRWSTTMTIIGCLPIFTLPIFIAGFRLNPRTKFFFNFNGSEAIIVNFDEDYANTMGIVNLGAYAFNIGITFVFTLLAIFGYMQMIKQNTNLSFVQKHEMKLLMQSTIMFLFLCVKFLYTIIKYLRGTNKSLSFFILETTSLQPYFVASYSFFGSSFLYLISAYAVNIEVIGHTITSINRYWVAQNLKRPRMWTPRTTKLCSLIIFLLSFSACCWRLLTPAEFFYSDKDFGIRYSNPHQGKIISYLNIAFYSINFFPSLYCTLRSIFIYRKYRKQNLYFNTTQKYEISLFIHTVIMFLMYCIRCTYHACILFATYYGNYDLIQVMQAYFTHVASSYSLLGSVFLIIVSSDVRKDYVTFYGLNHLFLKQQTASTTSS